jgi:hypothetical protein
MDLKYRSDCPRLELLIGGWGEAIIVVSFGLAGIVVLRGPPQLGIVLFEFLAYRVG